MGRKPKENPLKPMGLRLDPAILDRLRASGRGLSDEIRDRLQRTFVEDERDPLTRTLFDELFLLAEFLRSDFGGQWWHETPRAHEAFTAAVAQLLARYKPVEPLRSGPHASVPTVSDLFDIMDDPADAIGRMRERDIQRVHPNPHLEALARERGKRSSLGIIQKKEENDDQA